MRWVRSEQGCLGSEALCILAAASIGLVAAPAGAGPANDSRSVPAPISDGRHDGTTREATPDGEASCGVSDNAPDVWYVYQASCTGRVTFDTCGSPIDTVLSVHPDRSARPAVRFDSGGFENDTLGGAPSSGGGGSWHIGKTGGAKVEVFGPDSGARRGTAPGAKRGSQYLSASKDVGELVVAVSALAVAGALGEVVRADLDLYVDPVAPVGDGPPAMVNFTTSTGGGFTNRYTWLGFDYADNAGGVATPGMGPEEMVVVSYAGAWRAVTAGGAPMYVPRNAWLAVTIELIVGEQYAVTVNGVTSDPIDLEASVAGKNVVGLELRANVGNRPSQFFVDHLGIGAAGSEDDSACNEECDGDPFGGPASCVTAVMDQGESVLVRVAGAGGDGGDFTLNVACAPAPVPRNDDCTAASSVTEGRFEGTTLGASGDGSASCGSSDASPDVWYNYRAPEDGDLFVSVAGSTCRISPAPLGRRTSPW